MGGGRGEHTTRDVKGEVTWRFQGKGKDPYQQEHDDLFDAIRNNKPYNEAENGAHSTMTAIFGRMATYSGKMIEWDEAINSKISVMPKHFAWDAEPPVKPRSDGWYDHAVPGKSVVV